MNDVLKVTQFTGAEWMQTQTWLTPHRPSLEQSLRNTYPVVGPERTQARGEPSWPGAPLLLHPSSAHLAFHTLAQVAYVFAVHFTQQTLTKIFTAFLPPP